MSFHPEWQDKELLQQDKALIEATARRYGFDARSFRRSAEWEVFLRLGKLESQASEAKKAYREVQKESKRPQGRHPDQVNGEAIDSMVSKAASSRDWDAKLSVVDKLLRS